MPLFGSAIEYQNTNLERAVERGTVTCLIIRYHASVLRIPLIDYHSKSPDCLQKKRFSAINKINKSIKAKLYIYAVNLGNTISKISLTHKLRYVVL